MAVVEDPSLLALVLNDPLAPIVIAWWKSRRPGRPLVAVSDAPLRARERLDAATMEELCRVVREPACIVEATLERCEIAGLFESKIGGISSVADKWLLTHVTQQLSVGRPPRGQAPPAPAPAPAPAPPRGVVAPPPRKRERGAVTLALVVAVAVVATLSLCLAAQDRGPTTLTTRAA